MEMGNRNNCIGMWIPSVKGMKAGYAFFFVFILFTSMLVFFSNFAHSQGIAAYTDYRGAFQVFDRGVYQQLEYNPVKS